MNCDETILDLLSRGKSNLCSTFEEINIQIRAYPLFVLVTLDGMAPETSSSFNEVRPQVQFVCTSNVNFI